jgi:alpha-tubulin suppressor-like RCC1 family protein
MQRTHATTILLAGLFALTSGCAASDSIVGDDIDGGRFWSDAGTLQDTGTGRDGGTNTDGGTTPDAGTTPGIVIGTGYQSACALVDGGVWCWGSNGNGQLGNGSAEDSLVPTPVSGITDAVALSVGGRHACVIRGGGGGDLGGGEVWCWGQNAFGNLGDGTLDNRPEPVQVLGLTGPATAIAAGNYHTCALSQTGAVSCWASSTASCPTTGARWRRHCWE